MAATSFVQNEFLDKGIPVKKCTKCGERKPVEQFSKIFSRKSGRNKQKITSSRCKSCNTERSCQWREGSEENRTKYLEAKRAWAKNNQDKVIEHARKANLKRVCGMTVVRYEEAELSQKFLCKSCGEPESVFDKKAKRTKRLAVDHDHSTGEFRGLLCTRCNTALGLLKDDPEKIMSLAKYVLEHRRMRRDGSAIVGILPPKEESNV